jgi:two-component system sensor histidine kinase YesM
MKQAEEGNLHVRADCDNRDEIAELCHSFNVMIEKIKNLLEYTIEEQEHIKKLELKALQAQINPHFLYNTLDAIVWMTEADRKKEVVEITKTLSRFFRIVLSKGEEWISVRDEIDHVKSYLSILKVRYRDILEYEVDCEEDILECPILKLTLQPIVENALYHGIKNTRDGGKVSIRGMKRGRKELLFQVVDNGAGMEREELERIRTEININPLEVTGESGFGLRNVNQRIKLYYGAPWGLDIESSPGEGTSVSVVIPK